MYIIALTMLKRKSCSHPEIASSSACGGLLAMGVILYKLI
jgi:hypothetical protein